MDDIFLPDETEPETEDVQFEKAPVHDSVKNHPAGVDASDYVKITFDRFVSLVANRSFMDVVERNKNEDVILSTNLLTDLANAKSFFPKSRGPLMLLGGVILGIIIAYFLF